jgi:hypothetical protein
MESLFKQQWPAAMRAIFYAFLSEPGFGGIFEIMMINSQHQFSAPLRLCS